uniref:MATE family efflux transporter n=1 Tax=Eubacterium sp. TaxID=142586 RepID=UPI0040267252
MKNDLLKGSPVRAIIVFAMPIMLSSLLQFSYNFVDNIIIGRYVGTQALASVGNISSINSFIIGTALGLTSGFTIPVAQKFGAQEYKAMNKYAGNSIALSFIIGVIIAACAHIISDPILRAINTPDDIIELSAAYINILYFGVPIQMLFNNFTGIARALGDSKRPLYFLVISVVVNLFLDILLVKYLKMGVEGAAIATVFSYLVAALFAGIYVFRKQEFLRVKFSDLKPSLKICWEQMKLGIPVSLQFTITSVGSMVLQTAINSFGSSAIAAITAAGRVEQIMNVPMSGLGVSNSTFVSQNYGAKQYERILKAVKNIFLLDIVVSLFCSAVLIFVGPHVVQWFVDEPAPEILGYAKQYLYTIGGCYVFVSILFVLRNTLQGLGFTYANTIAGAGELIGRILVSYIFTPIFGFAAVCFAGPCAWVLADIPLVVIYLIKRKTFKALIKTQE